MIRVAIVAMVAVGLAVMSSSSPASSQVHRAPDTAALVSRLGATRDGARIPLLLELVELKREEPAQVLPLTDELFALLARYPSASAEALARIARSHALQAQGDYRTALSEARQAERLAMDVKTDSLVAAAYYEVAFVEWRMADYAAALAKAEAARRLQVPRGNSVALVRTLNLLGGIHQSQSALDEALESYLSALGTAEALGDEISMARSHNNIGLAHWDMGRYQEALAAMKRALAIHERLGPKAPLANTLNNMGLILLELERPRESIPFLERALVIDRESGNLYGQAKNFSNLGWAYGKLQDWGRALEFHSRALTLREQIGDKEGIVRSLGAHAELQVQRGAPAAAIPLFERSIALAADIGDLRDEADYLGMLSEARAAVGDSAGALVAHRRFHLLQQALNDSVSRRNAAELQARYRLRESDRDLAALAALAESRREELRLVLVGSGLLAVCLVLLAVSYVLRTRAQRALAESEQRYRALFRSSVVPTFLIEADGRRILELNDAARELCGDLPGSARGLLPEIEPEWVRRALSMALDSSNTDPVAFDDCWSDPSGRMRCSEVRGSSVALGGRACRLVSVRDATERRAEEEARQRDEKLRSLGVLAGGIAHDFNNALTAIVGHISLARGCRPSERDEMLALAEKAALGASRLTAQLLAFSKGGAPQLRSASVEGPLRDSVALAAAGSGMQVEFDISEGLWPALLDAAQFGQVVRQLVSNAQHASAPNGRLRVRASNFVGDFLSGPSREGQRFVRLDFADDGAGIPKGIRDRVFDPFFTTRPGGSGLGLTAAYAICRNHGGNLSFESREGQGTTFSAFFPAAGEQVAESVPVQRDEPGEHARILVLDDDPLVRGVLVRMLENWGYDVEAVADGLDAVRRYLDCRDAGTPFGLVIMDLTIPNGMGGRQAIAEILRHDPHVRAIVASGYSDDPIMASFREAGFAAALAKPFEQSELAQVVSSVLRSEAQSLHGGRGS